MSSQWLISCEHAGNQIPDAYKPLFQGADMILQSHRGYDPGALELFRLLSGQLSDHSYYAETSRLLVELNRSLHHKNLFSSFTKPLSPSLKGEIISNYYLPYRQQVEEKIRELTRLGRQVIHLSIHSFTPELNGVVRNADIGLLYDPSRTAEKLFCQHWKSSLQEHKPEAVVRFNYPYLGKADGFTTFLRRQFPQQYIGIELEVNQKYAGDQAMNRAILHSLASLKAAHTPG